MCIVIQAGKAKRLVVASSSLCSNSPVNLFFLLSHCLSHNTHTNSLSPSFLPVSVSPSCVTPPTFSSPILFLLQWLRAENGSSSRYVSGLFLISLSVPLAVPLVFPLLFSLLFSYPSLFLAGVPYFDVFPSLSCSSSVLSEQEMQSDEKSRRCFHVSLLFPYLPLYLRLYIRMYVCVNLSLGWDAIRSMGSIRFLLSKKERGRGKKKERKRAENEKCHGFWRWF